jgi:uncharacterized Zn-finger protein
VHDVQQQASASQGWNSHNSLNHPPGEQPTLAVSQFRDSAQLSFNVPQHSHHDSSAGLSTPNTQIHTEHQTDGYLFFQPRMRSKSETSLHPPQWNNPPSFLTTDQMNTSESALDDGSSTIDMHHTLASLNDQAQLNQSSNTSQQSLGQLGGFGNFQFGTSSSQLHPDYLSPDFGAQIRRSKSDSARVGFHHRQSRSEDVRHSPALLFPPTSQHTQDLINRQYLSPQEPLPSIRGHYRRASSGSRQDRTGAWSNPSSTRPSPYPTSASASPRMRYEELPTVPLSGRQGSMLTSDIENAMTGQPEQRIIVSKPTVTTGRTANASHKRRKQEANFTCPVPGCGSTFTRSFNLKGHLRSHNEEKPFQCKWPGCGKGFARQHDCKRHEQLHSNYRPFICEGCSKPFARMDALNRHRAYYRYLSQPCRMS